MDCISIPRICSYPNSSQETGQGFPKSGKGAHTYSQTCEGAILCPHSSHGHKGSLLLTWMTSTTSSHSPFATLRSKWDNDTDQENEEGGGDWVTWGSKRPLLLGRWPKQSCENLCKCFKEQPHQEGLQEKQTLQRSFLLLLLLLFL